MKQNRILIKENYRIALTRDFEVSLTKLRETLSTDKLNEVGLSLSTALLRDMLFGGHRTEEKVLNSLNEAFFSPSQLPMQRRQAAETVNMLLNELRSIIRSARSAMSEFRFVPVEYFYVSPAGSIEVTKEGEQMVQEAANLYIDQPEQIEVYQAADAVIMAVETLQSLASRFGCNAFGSRGVLALIGDKLEVVPDVITECYSDGVWHRNS